MFVSFINPITSPTASRNLSDQQAKERLSGLGLMMTSDGIALLRHTIASGSLCGEETSRNALRPYTRSYLSRFHGIVLSDHLRSVE